MFTLIDVLAYSGRAALTWGRSARKAALRIHRLRTAFSTALAPAAGVCGPHSQAPTGSGRGCSGFRQPGQRRLDVRLRRVGDDAPRLLRSQPGQQPGRAPKAEESSIRRAFSERSHVSPGGARHCGRRRCVMVKLFWLRMIPVPRAMPPGTAGAAKNKHLPGGRVGRISEGASTANHEQ